MTRYGHTGHLRHVDLSTGSAHTEELSDEEWRRYAGGGLLGVRRLLTDTPSGLDPFAPEALLQFMSSVVAGHPTVGLARFAVIAKSPLTGGIGEARVTGPFGGALKGSGYDGLLVRGRAPEPSYLLVDGTDTRVCPAAELWGSETHVATEALKTRHGPTAHVATIGPAGERLVRYASIISEWSHPAARMGLGAVMGAKNLKAVVVLPAEAPLPYDRDAMGGITAGYRDRMAANPLTAAQASATGFGGWFLDGDFTGYAGVANFLTSVIETPKPGTAAALAARLRTSQGQCPGCPNDCVKRYDNDVDERLGGLDEEGLAALVLGCGVTDIGEALRLHARCLALGVDPVSLAGTLAFLREVRPGCAHDPGTDVERIAERSSGYRGLGEGVRVLADALGAPAAAMHVKGLEMPRYDPRVSAGQALAYAVSPLGPRYEIVEHDLDFDPVDGPPHGLDQMATLGTYDWEPMARLDVERVARTVTLMELWSGLDALCVCLFAGPPMRELTQHTVAALVHAVTGWRTSDHELFLWGRRRLNLMRLYNLREGIDAGDDTLPDRFFTHPVDAGRHRGAVLDRSVFADSVQRYYALMGWNARGEPTSATLISLGLEWAMPEQLP